MIVFVWDFLPGCYISMVSTLQLRILGEVDKFQDTNNTDHNHIEFLTDYIREIHTRQIY